MTLVAESEPSLVVPYADRLAPLLDHSFTRARWESMHALALITPHIPGVVARLLPIVAQMIQDDTSTIVRDHGVKMISSYAAIGPAQAEESYPILMEALTAWGGKHAHHALPGLRHVADYHPTHRAMIRAAAQVLVDHPRRVVRGEAQRLLRSLGE
jgi:hypothetical protein